MKKQFKVHGTDAELARVAKVSPAQLSDWRNNIRLPSFPGLMKLSQAVRSILVLLGTNIGTNAEARSLIVVNKGVTIMAERVGFEPTVRVKTVHALSKRAP